MERRTSACLREATHTLVNLGSLRRHNMEVAEAMVPLHLPLSITARRTTSSRSMTLMVTRGKRQSIVLPHLRVASNIGEPVEVDRLEVVAERELR